MTEIKHTMADKLNKDISLLHDLVLSSAHEIKLLAKYLEKLSKKTPYNSAYSRVYTANKKAKDFEVVADRTLARIHQTVNVEVNNATKN